METVRIWMAGDSTMSDYDESVAPRMGWGQVLGRFLKPEAVVLNKAASGRSSKSFINEGRLDEIREGIGPGDYFLIQFGHNDEKPDEERRTEPYTTYKQYLKQYINAAREKGAHPVLLTPVERRKFDEAGRLVDTHGEYPAAMKQLAEEEDVPLIDLGAKTRQLLERLGPEESKRLFLWFEPGERENYPEGAQDDTHFSEYGAEQVARLALEGFRELELGLANFIK